MSMLRSIIIHIQQSYRHVSVRLSIISQYSIKLANVETLFRKSYVTQLECGLFCLLPRAKKKHLIYDVYSKIHMQKKHQKYSNQAKVGNFPNISAPIPNISRYHGYTIASRQHLNNWGWRFRGQADSSNNLTQHRHHLVKLNNGKVVKQQIAGGKSTEMTSKKVQVIYFTVYRLNLEKNTALYKISPQSFCSV